MSPDNRRSQGHAPEGALTQVDTPVEFHLTQATPESPGKIALIRHRCRHPVHFTWTGEKHLPLVVSSVPITRASALVPPVWEAGVQFARSNRPV